MNAALQAIYSAILPSLLEIIAVVLGALLIRATETARTRWGIEIEARHREALHSAMMSGIRAALARGLSGEAAISAAISYAGQSVPDALAKLSPTGEVLQSIAEAKLREVMAGAPWFGLDLAKPGSDKSVHLGAL